MRHTLLLALSLFVSAPLMIGCGKETGTVATEDSLDAYLQENPDVMIDEGEEEALMEADAAVEE